MGSFFIFLIIFVFILFVSIMIFLYIYEISIVIAGIELKQIINWFFNKNPNKKVENYIKNETVAKKQGTGSLIAKNSNNIEIKEKNILETKLPPKIQIIDIPENLEIKKETQSIFLDEKILLDDHFNLSNREFRKKYSQDLKIIEISDGFEKGNPIFETSSTGKYIAIKYENDKYLVFYSKGTNITSENHSVISIFTLDQEIEKYKIYENWKINKPALFLLNNDDTWSIEEKGIINLDFNKEEVKSNIINNIETKKDVLITYSNNNLEKKKTHIELIKEVINNWEFMKKYTNAVTLDITNTDDVVYRNNEPIFNESEQGKYIAINLAELGNSNHYLFYAKGTNITSEDIALKTVFNFDKEIEIGKIYDDWEIIQPAILSNNNNNWQIIKKGTIGYKNG